MSSARDLALIDQLRALALTRGQGATASLSVHCGDTTTQQGAAQFSYTVSLTWNPDAEGNPRDIIAQNRATVAEAFKAAGDEITATSATDR